MKNPDLVLIYAHLLCNEALSEATEDAAQHLFKRTFDLGLVTLGGGHDDQDECSEFMMARLLKVSATADVELSRLAHRLEALLRSEFPTKLMPH
jgi:hypothetical protein